MRIVFHAVAARKGKEGGATYMLGRTAEALAKEAPDHEYIFCLDKSVEIPLPPGTRRIDIDFGSSSSHRGGAARLRFDQVEYPKILRREGADLSVAALGIGTFRPGTPQVTMHPDSTYFCEYASFGRGRREMAAIAARRQAMERTVRASIMAILPSRSMEIGMKRTLGTSNVTEVIRYGWDGKTRAPAQRRPGPPVKLVYISHLQRHKAHLHLVPIAQALLRRGIDFEIAICISREDDPWLYDRFVGLIRRNRLERHFVLEARVSDDRLRELYANADAMLYPSLCESFGFAMVEATASGIPVVAADTEINREILGPGGLFFPPLEPAMAATRISEILEDRCHAAELVKLAQDHQVRTLPTWDEYGRRLAALLERAAGK